MTLATIKQDIIKQYNRLLNKKYISAFNFLLSPCCTIHGEGVALCTDINVFTLTITLDQSLPSFPVPFGILINTEDAVLASGVYTSPDTITATITFPAGGSINVTQAVGVSILYPTSSDGSIGVYHNFLVSDVVFNGNPCD